MMGSLAGPLNHLISRLTDLICKEYAKLKGVQKQARSLTKELISIDIALDKYTRMEEPDMQVKAWMKEVQELAYDIEDCIDIFAYRINHETSSEATSIMGLLRKNIRKVKKLHYKHKFADQIQQLKTLANEVYERRIKYRLDECTTFPMHKEVDPRLAFLYVGEDKLVGIESPTEEIISRIIEKRNRPLKQCRVVSVVGPGGLGKTTLANQVYQRIKGQFDCTAFVSVSRKPDMNHLLWGMLSEVDSTGQLPGLYNDRQLINRLRECLVNKRYLIVIDDIWSKSAWETIQCAFPKNACGSIIIMTTRINTVAKCCCSSDEDFVYKMQHLNKRDSKSLFLKRTFGSKDKCPLQLEQIMDEILQKCDGLPLAIITIASLLADKPKTKAEWTRVRNSIGSMREKDIELEVIDKIISLSYCDLPRNIKTCLLYLSIFPEDSEISRDCLIWRWIAEGFIVAKHGYSLKELGESYFNELINRSMIQPVHMDYGGTARSCRVHDIILDFIITKSTEENLVTILDGQDFSTSSSDKIRRLSIRKKKKIVDPGIVEFRFTNDNDMVNFFWDTEFDEGTLLQETMSFSHLRSLTLFGPVNWMPPLLDRHVLRVLDLHGCHHMMNDHIEDIGNLCQLRYLGLGRTYIKILPVQIRKLEFLQTIDIRGTCVQELPRSITELKQLMRLESDSIELPDGFANMAALQELSWLHVCKISRNFAQDLGNLSNLRVLKIILHPQFLSYCQEIYQESLVSSLCKLGEHNLRYLHIKHNAGEIDFLVDSWWPPPRLLQKFVMNGFCYFSRFPKWINSSLSELSYLDIDVKVIAEEELNMLGGLPSLRVLRLFLNRIPEEGFTVSSGGFQYLSEFHLHNGHGPGIKFKAGAMPNVQVLVCSFHACESVRVYGDFDFGVQHLSSLGRINVEICYTDERVVFLLEAAESAIKNEIKLLPKHPMFMIRRKFNRNSCMYYA
ncbi:hypothetical protein OsI_33666 [Oryza sativa Indica Group]|uniref:Uncharacterized protein n=1 Tax=Oryza sativa subsp. indica TaxID=39946 RepID=B8BGY1_ORYSI|nr:hypothetical protein OsI_33666 [Oryza sativa Indica Group]